MNIEMAVNVKKFLKIDSKSHPLIDDLESFILRAQEYYYGGSKELVSDKEYDALELILKEFKPKSAALRTRAPEKNKKIKVKLPWKMSSLNKVNPAQGNVQKWIDANKGPYVVSAKLDGSSIQIVYDKDGNIKAYTGGDGNIGGDISYLVPWLKLPNKKFKNVALRGEALVSRGAFKKYKDVFKNPRALANGLINSEKIKSHVKDLEVVFYTVLSPTTTVSTGFKWLKSNGFNTAVFKEVDSVSPSMLSRMLTKAKAKSKYDLDGLVVSRDVRQIPTLENPDYAMAFKEIQGDDIVSTVVTGIDWEESSHGYIIPTVLLKAVELFGTTVQRASGHNARFILDNGIGKGAVVSITKGGEVIPKILSVVKPAKADMPDMTERGPFGVLHWDKKSTHLVMEDMSSSSLVTVKRIVRFFSGMDVEGLKMATVSRLVDAGYDSILKIVKLDKREIGDAIGSQKTAETIHSSMIKQFGDADLAQFMDSSGAFGRGFGSRRVEMIQKEYPEEGVLGLVNMNKRDLYEVLSRVNGIGGEMAKLFVNGLPQFLSWYQKWPKGMVKFAKKEVVKVSGKKMLGQRIIFTGVRSPELENWIIANGGEIVTNGKKATICIVKSKDSASSKRVNAESVGAKIMTVSEFMERYKV